jgi:hypothetical protein
VSALNVFGLAILATAVATLLWLARRLTLRLHKDLLRRDERRRARATWEDLR